LWWLQRADTTVRMKLRVKITNLACGLVLSLAMSACAGQVEDGEPEVPLTFEEFEAQAAREPGTGYYVVDGDMVLATREELREQYALYLDSTEVESTVASQTQALIVHRVDGSDSTWPEGSRRLTYCVSTTFGNKHDQVVAALESATRAWEAVANVDYVHVPEQDASCTRANTQVVFDVNLVRGAGYYARAFFPYNVRARRNVLIDGSAFGNLAPITLEGVLRHELGHTLGFRHEHTRPQAGGVCLEDKSWRALTAYDSSSVMHYPWCNGTNEGDLDITQRDATGAAGIYPF
jgi:hypothetical protein